MSIKKIKAGLLAVSSLCVAALYASGCGSGEVSPDSISADSAQSAETVSVEHTVSADNEQTSANEENTSTSRENDYEKESFYVSKINDEIFELINGKSYSDDCTVPVGDLRYLHILHKDLAGETHEGELICNKMIAADLIEIFEELYKAAYPIEKMILVDEYDADDESSMRDNNSSSFNFRFISGTDEVSMHGLGLAVDINPLYNPFVTEIDGELYIEPDTAWDYVDRSSVFPYKIEGDDLCVRLFKSHGFDWGGDWENEKDYQHFEKNI